MLSIFQQRANYRAMNLPECFKVDLDWIQLPLLAHYYWKPIVYKSLPADWHSYFMLFLVFRDMLKIQNKNIEIAVTAIKTAQSISPDDFSFHM